MKKIIPQFIRNIYHLGQAILANFIFSFPSKNLIVIGVTGTNGKTTTVHMITAIFEEAGYKVAAASTINFKIGEKKWVNETKFTTLSSFQVQKFLRQAADAKCQYAILETSSHSLDQNRVWGIKYKIAAITNVTREHLDYHRNMEEYRVAKLKLFNRAETAVVNLDMAKPEEFLQCGAENAYGYTAQNQNVKIKMQNGNEKLKIIVAKNIKTSIDHSKYQIQDTEYQIHLPGLFNIENALAATCAGLSQSIDLKTIKIALEKIAGIPGRMEYVPNDKNIDIIIDYAVTPDSLEKLYFLINTIKCHSCESRNLVNKSKNMRLDSRLRGNDNKSKIISVFGACGERDRGKRPIMGSIVDKYADRIILTNEDPYNENPEQIVNDLTEGIKNKKEGESLWKILDRREAIKKALRMAEPGDIVAVTGKGAEVTMAIGKKRIPWSDKAIILEELRFLN